MNIPYKNELYWKCQLSTTINEPERRKPENKVNLENPSNLLNERQKLELIKASYCLSAKNNEKSPNINTVIL